MAVCYPSPENVNAFKTYRNLFNTFKVPKREIFVTELIILSHPIWIGDLRTKAKNRLVRIVRLLFAILVFFR